MPHAIILAFQRWCSCTANVLRTLSRSKSAFAVFDHLFPCERLSGIPHRIAFGISLDKTLGLVLLRRVAGA